MNIENSANSQIVYTDWDISSITTTVPTSITNTTVYDPTTYTLNITFDGAPGTSGSTVPVTVTMVLKDKRKLDNDITLTKTVNMQVV